jgi:hypothetical protein
MKEENTMDNQAREEALQWLDSLTDEGFCKVYKSVTGREPVKIHQDKLQQRAEISAWLESLSDEEYVELVARLELMAESTSAPAKEQIVAWLESLTGEELRALYWDNEDFRAAWNRVCAYHGSESPDGTVPAATRLEESNKQALEATEELSRAVS